MNTKHRSKWLATALVALLVSMPPTAALAEGYEVTQTPPPAILVRIGDNR